MTTANFLTDAAYDPDSKIPEYKVCAVRIEPVEEADEWPNPPPAAG